MSTWGARLGKLRSVEIPPEVLPQLVDVVYSNWSGGLDVSDPPEDLEPNRTSHALNMEVSRQDRLIRAPGVIIVEDANPRIFKHLIEHPAIDYASELVAIDPPWLGIKGTGNFTWYNLGIAATGAFGWTGISVLGILIFSNGFNKTYSRVWGAPAVTDISGQIIARAFGSAFGRVFAAGYMSGGAYQAMGIAWNNADGDPVGWTGLGSGAEHLIPDVARADRIMGLRPIGNDALGVVCRHSLWMGLRTRRVDRPADFRQFSSGFGCAAERTITAGPTGVTFLSDEGVVTFDGNTVDIISGPINGQLLPLDYTRISGYTAAFDPRGLRYILCTPNETWVYEFATPDGRPARWFKRSIIADSVVTFTDQSGSVGWDSVVGSWDAQSSTWDTLVQNQSDAPGRLYFAKGMRLGREDYSTQANFGENLLSYWRTPHSSKVRVTEVVTTHAYEIEYRSFDNAVVNFVTPDIDGDFDNIITRTLPNSRGAIARRLIEEVTTGMGVALQIEVASGLVEILRVRQVVQPSGPNTTVAL